MVSAAAVCQYTAGRVLRWELTREAWHCGGSFREERTRWPTDY